MTVAVRLSLFYVAFFFATGVQLPFWPVWLVSRGLGPTEIGALLAVGQWIRVATSPVIGMLADRATDRRRVMVLLGALAVAGYLLCLPAYGWAALVLPTALTAATAAALLPIADSLALASGPGARLDYGRVRLWGTVAFIAATLIGGRILQGRTPDIVLYLLLGTAAVTTASCAWMPRVTVVRRAAAPTSWRVFLHRRYLLFIAAASLIQSSHTVYYAFGTLYWQRLGHSDATIAWLWAEGAIAEVVLFYFSAPLLRWLGPHGLLLLSGGGAVVRWTATAAATSLPALIALQPLHALSFAAGHLGAMHFIARAVPPERAVTAQSLYATIVNGVVPGIFAVGTGALYAAIGGSAYYAMAAMGAAGAVFATRLVRSERYLASMRSE